MMDERPALICYDGSQGSSRAIDEAAALLAPRRAVVLGVAPFVTAVESLAVAAPVSLAEFSEGENIADSQQQADEGAAHARSAGFDAVARTDIATPTWGGIVEVADELDAAVIVIGTRALKGLHELFEGSVSHEVVQHAGRPVLVVPPERRG